jgi:3-phenylpropionate/cinnamic acid dioxygenase small subunit
MPERFQEKANEAMTQTSFAPATSPAIETFEIAQFLFEEARLLDDREFEKWSDLFLDEGIYWVPAKPGQESPLDHVSLFYDDKETMQTRIRRLRHPLVHTQIPHSSTVHIISNVVLETSAADGDTMVRSNFIMLEDRPSTERRLFGGSYVHRLRKVDGGLRIVQKRVNLTNSTASFPALALPI